MPTHRPHPGPPRWLRLPRPTARLRLTVLYAASFLVCSAAVVTFVYVFYGHLVHFSHGLPTMRLSGRQSGGSPGRKAAGAVDAAVTAQVNAALQEAAGQPAVRTLLLQARSAADQAVLGQIH
jgi:hypothetical protein